MKTTAILVAAVLLQGGVKAKDGTVSPFELPAGEELTEEAAARLGLDDDGIKTLLADGKLVEQQARLAEGSDGVDAAELAAANKRADEAEAKVKELTESNDALTKKVAELEAAAKAKASGAQA